jgi:hypothetical protein
MFLKLNPMLNIWRIGMWEDGWKMARKEIDLLRRISEEDTDVEEHNALPPAYVAPVPWYINDSIALKVLLNPMTTPTHHVRLKVIMWHTGLWM